MRAARGQFPKFELNRLGNAFYQSPTPLGQSEDDFAALGGQLDEGGGDWLVGNIAGAEPVHAGAPPGLSVAPDTERDRPRPCAQYLDCPATLGGQFRESACNRLAHSVRSRGQAKDARRAPRRRANSRHTTRAAPSLYERASPVHGLVSASPHVEPPNLSSSTA